MKVISTDDTSWLEFTRCHTGADIFHSPEWSRLLSTCYRCEPSTLALQDSVGKIIAGIPIARKKSLSGGDRLISLPSTDHCAPLLSDQVELDDFNRHLANHINSDSSSRYELRWEYQGIHDLHPRKEYVLHVLELSPDFDQTTRLIHSMHKRNADIAQKRGVQLVMGVDDRHLHDFYRLHMLTRRKKGVPVQPWQFFKTMQLSIFQKKLGFLLLAYHESKCLAASIFLHWNKTLTYKFGASDPEGLKLRPNDLIFWTAIRWACENSCSYLDFGRTDLSNIGLREYKNRWGAVEKDLYYSYYPSCPDPRMDWIMSFSERTLRHLPFWLYQIVSEVLYRIIGS